VNETSLPSVVQLIFAQIASEQNQGQNLFDECAVSARSYFDQAAAERDDNEIGRNPDLWLYRERTIALLKRYLRLSVEVGRLPSLLGRELFRSKVTAYRMASFEDAVIFVHDVERAVANLDGFARDLVSTIVFQDYSQEEAAEVLQCGRRTVCRQFPDAIDRISEMFLAGGLLNRLPCPSPVENSCQEGQSTQISPTTSKQDE
jgi:DNA-directed RNA polymerase specialized sigma24 family protein